MMMCCCCRSGVAYLHRRLYVCTPLFGLLKPLLLLLFLHLSELHHQLVRVLLALLLIILLPREMLLPLLPLLPCRPHRDPRDVIPLDLGECAIVV